MRPTATGQFSGAVIDELLRALIARASDHPDSPGLVASWPGVPASAMPAACTELRRQGHPVHEISILSPRAKPRRAWAIDLADGDRPAPGARLSEEPTLLLRGPAEPATVPLARAALTALAEAAGLPTALREALTLALAEACANVVFHAYVDADLPGELEVRAWREGALMILEVADQGRGMVPHIDHPGHGFGLPLITQVADLVELRTGAGTVVRMHFRLDGPRSV